MRLQNRQLLYFGPIAVCIEWFAILLALNYKQEFNPHHALSTATTSAQPLPLVFGVTLSVVAVTYALFAFALRSYSRYIPLLGFISAISFTLTGWIPYTGTGGTHDILHNICSFISVACYIGIVWQLSKHPKKHIRNASTVSSSLLVLGVILSFISMYAIHQYIAFVQLHLLFIIQCWTVFIVWHERKYIREQSQ